MTINADQSGILKCIENDIIFSFDRLGLKNKTTTLKNSDIVDFDSYRSPSGSLVAKNIFLNIKENQSLKSKKQNLSDNNKCLAKIKLFNKSKGFGFVQCQTQDKTEAFLHVSELQKADITSFDVGDFIMVNIKENYKGKYVANVARPTETDLIYNRNEQELNKTEKLNRVLACVKFYDKIKKFGFLTIQTTPNTDAYISEAELLKANVRDIDKGDYLMVRIRDGIKGKKSAYNIKKALPIDLQMNMKPDVNEVESNKNEKESSGDILKNEHSKYNLYKHEPLRKNKEHLESTPFEEKIKTEKTFKSSKTDCNKYGMTKSFKSTPGVIQTKITDYTISEEGKKIQKEIDIKKKYLEKAKTLNIPDGTGRLQKKIKELEEKFEQIKIKDLQAKNESKLNTVKKEINTHDKSEETFRRSLENMKISLNSENATNNTEVKKELSAREKVNDGFRRSLEELKISGNDRGEAKSLKKSFKFDFSKSCFGGRENVSLVRFVCIFTSFNKT